VREKTVAYREYDRLKRRRLVSETQIRWMQHGEIIDKEQRARLLDRSDYLRRHPELLDHLLDE